MLIQEDLVQMEQALRDNLKSPIPIIPQVAEYMFLSGGKRFRPSLLLFSSKLAGYRGDRHIPLACTVEFLHTATLLHDDVVDDADMRRGKASVNSVWGNQASVLIGDFFLARSLSLLVSDNDSRILSLFCRTTEKMAEGEVLQLTQTNNADTREEEYLDVVINKTASLISTACRTGAILGNLAAPQEEALGSYGLNLGIAFQLVDDALDYVSGNRKFGKETGTDLRAGKMTLPLIYLLTQGEKAERAQVRRFLEKGEVAKEEVGPVVELVRRAGGIAYALDKARQFASCAKGDLSLFGNNEFAEALAAVADYVVEREV